MPYKEGARGVKGLYKERSPTQAGAQPLIRAMPLSSATTDLPAKGTDAGGGLEGCDVERHRWGGGDFRKVVGVVMGAVVVVIVIIVVAEC